MILINLHRNNDSKLFDAVFLLTILENILNFQEAKSTDIRKVFKTSI